MKFELFDEPVLLIKSILPLMLNDSEEETLIKIESLLQDEISLIKEDIDKSSQQILNNYLTPFNLHLQINNEINSILLENEWNQLESQKKFLEELSQENFDVIDDEEDNYNKSTTEEEQQQNKNTDFNLNSKVSELQRIVRIIYNSPDERIKIFDWLSQKSKENQNFPFISNFGDSDFLLLPAKTIFPLLSSLQNLCNIT